ncbi:MAG: sn-glycerol-3-phosphate ABC transporter ATP-binding protein UgpC [Fibrobacteraceae bacterium]
MADFASSVSLRNVTKVFPGASEAVNSLSLDIRKGEFLVLVGPSGCGKSTMLRLIAGLDTPTSGEILVGDKRATELDPRDRDIAMVFQTLALYPHMTVRENLEFGLKLGGRCPAGEIRERVRETAEILDLQPILDRKPKHLSGGQRQRVALGRAMVRKPKIFLFDEPLSNLDARMRNQMRVELGRLHSRLQATMIFVTHDQTEAMTMGDRIVCMNGGRIQQVGTPMELYAHPANEFVAGFIGVPPMNIFSAQWGNGSLFIEKAGLSIATSEALAAAFRSHSRLSLGIRPEDLSVGASSPKSISAVVEVIESLGSETLVYTQSGDLSLVVRVPAASHYEVGEKLFLSMNEEKIHLFDISTGECFH